MKTETVDHYQLSPRIVLRPGDRMRVSRGPYWRTASGGRIPVAARGVCTFLSCLRRGRRVFILARGRDGTVVLHVEGRRRNADMPELVCRPYRVKRLQSKKNTKAIALGNPIA